MIYLLLSWNAKAGSLIVSKLKTKSLSRERIVKPTIGRIVHYVARQYSLELSHHPAIITRVEGTTGCSLTVFHENSEAHMVRVPQDEDKKQIGTWHWPEKVEDES